MSYAPININNPFSLCYVVKTWPGQRIELSLEKKYYPNAKITVNNLIRVYKFEEDDSFVRWTIIQNADFEDWSKYSACFLGDIWIDSDDVVARLVIILQSSTPSKTDYLTIINPSNDCVKINPYQIMEIIVYDDRFGYQDEWNWSWSSGSDGIELEELAVDHLTVFGFQNKLLNVDNPEYQYARCPRIIVSGDDFCRQHHFWFRLGNSVLNSLPQEKELQYLGLLTIRGYADQYHKHATQTVDHSVAIYADLKNKFRQQVIRTLGVQQQELDSLFPKKWASYSQPVKKKNLLYVKDVNISKLDDEINDNCRTAASVPPERSKWSQYNDDDFYFVGSDYQRFQTYKYRS